MSSPPNQPSGYLQLLQRRQYYPFLISQIMTNFGDGLFAVAVIAYAMKLGASATDLGIITFCLTLPRGLLGPVGGVIADKTDRRKLLIAIEVVRIGVVLALPVMGLAVHFGYWALAAIGLVVSSIFSMGAPAAKALIPKLVKADDLQLANSLAQAIVWPAYFIGAGVLALPGMSDQYDLIFYLVAACFVISLLALIGLPRGVPSTESKGLTFKGFLQDLGTGYRVLHGNTVLHARVMLYGVYTFFWRGILQVLLPILVARQFDDPGLYGSLMLVNGGGELFANLVMGKLKFRQPLVPAFYGETVIGAAALLIVLSLYLPDPRIGLFAAAFLIGVSASLIDIPMFTVVQKEIPEQHLGKVISYWFTIGSFGGAMGTLLCGRTIEYVAPTTASTYSGIGLILLSVVALMWAKRHLDAPAAVPTAPPASAGRDPANKFDPVH